MVWPSPKVKAAVDGLLTLSLVLPLTVAGFFLLLVFGRRRPIGTFLSENLDIRVVQTWLGCVIAATVIAFAVIFTVNLISAKGMRRLKFLQGRERKENKREKGKQKAGKE